MPAVSGCSCSHDPWVGGDKEPGTKLHCSQAPRPPCLDKPRRRVAPSSSLFYQKFVPQETEEADTEHGSRLPGHWEADGHLHIHRPRTGSWESANCCSPPPAPPANSTVGG